MLARNYSLKNYMSIRKQTLDLTIRERAEVGRGTYLLKLTPQEGVTLPACGAGQFVQVEVPGGLTLLRRPISVCNYLPERNELWLLIARVGRGTIAITDKTVGESLNIILPLGNTFNTEHSRRPVLLGGGVGIAPMLALAQTFVAQGIRPTVILGGRTAELVTLREYFEPIAELYITTDDGSLGYKGRITEHPALLTGDYDVMYCCGPHVMMHAVHRVAEARGISCQVSLENTMACGIGACLCCVQDTHEEGNLCVCTEGPVFNSQSIKW